MGRSFFMLFEFRNQEAIQKV